jgi:hypothetical protein
MISWAFMTRSLQTRTLMLLGLAAALIVVLAASLGGLEMRPGSPLPLPGLPSAGGASALAPYGELLLLVFRASLALLVVLLPVYILVSLMSVEGRRRLVSHLIAMGLVMALALWLSNLPELPLPALTAEQQPQQQDVQALAAELPPVPEFITHIPDWLTPVAIVAISGLAAGAVFLVARQLRLTRPAAGAPLPVLGAKVQTALDALAAGADLNDVITRCYLQMSAVLRETRGIQRDEAMTTTEFALALRARGFPAAPVGQLTRLFEQVRYSRHAATDRDRQLAIDNLESFLAYCGRESVIQGAGTHG